LAVGIGPHAFAAAGGLGGWGEDRARPAGNG